MSGIAASLLFALFMSFPAMVWPLTFDEESSTRHKIVTFLIFVGPCAASIFYCIAASIYDLVAA